MSGITEDRLVELEALCEAATPGPWEASARGCNCCWSVDPPASVEWSPEHDSVVAYVVNGDPAFHPNNAKFIATARTAMPALIAEVRRQSERIVELETDQPVHCLDCKHYGPEIDRCWLDDITHSPMFYCANGRRREDSDNEDE